MNYIGYVFYSYLTDFSKIWIVLWGIMNIPPVKNKKVYIVTGTVQSILLLIAGILYKDNRDIVAIFWTVLVITTVCYLFEGKYLKKMANSLLAYLLVLFLDASIGGICSLLDIRSGNRLTYLSINLVNVITLGFFVLIKRLRKKRALQVNISKRIYALLFAGAGTGILLIAGLVVRSNSAATETARRAMIIVTIVVVVSYCAACLMMVFVTESRDNYKALSLINQSIIESQQQYYMLVHEKQQEIRSIRHEMKNHLACIRGLYQANKLSEMEQYINDLIETSNGSANLFDTGNDIVNAILNDAQRKCGKENISIRLEGGFPPELYVAPMDLCVIFANIITNAVEAIERIEPREAGISYIDVKISSFKDELYIDVKNPIGNKVEMLNGKLLTSKKDKSFHGFGVKNVIQRVEKYHGSYNFKIKENHFWAEINMKNRA